MLLCHSFSFPAPSYNASIFSQPSRVPLYCPTASKSPDRAMAPMISSPLKMRATHHLSAYIWRYCKYSSYRNYFYLFRFVPQIKNYSVVPFWVKLFILFALFLCMLTYADVCYVSSASVCPCSTTPSASCQKENPKKINTNHTSAYVVRRQPQRKSTHTPNPFSHPRSNTSLLVSFLARHIIYIYIYICIYIAIYVYVYMHTSAYVSIRQHTPARDALIKAPVADVCWRMLTYADGLGV